ncbi:plasmid maintenance system killer [Candidatus Falkowbacteria bacterium CG11_big_fil_rev_8_21_14_0_20_39_10]|uniref:Plasmid maintenance system killer n=1 Tax=Candidatus Falkowbacteria bacterium CG11_big_fil_rev_8_21_14_0_20_39_10 TaxID=1974570 RepID=A0A2M6K849_9BACT|nr:MAG: plasmid maintenance system killer [Candidatus Falkowbacteria bacterium CG11_big_fil_rev_8_21_14_0_20_39_10]
MIKSFKCREAQKIYNREYSRKLPQKIQKTAIRKLWMINAAASLSDLRLPPANCLEPLKGGRKGQYSIRVNDQWRICFKWAEGDAYNIEIIDYH